MTSLVVCLPVSAGPVFFDGFDKKLGDAWHVAEWANGAPFGGRFTAAAVTQSERGLSLSFDGSDGYGGEIRTRQFWQYGHFISEMKPAAVPGTVSSFFLYAGKAGSHSHFEIDIEFLGGRPLMHTNFWRNGVPQPKDIDLVVLGIDPFIQKRKYGIVWRPDYIAWQVMDDHGNWLELRRETVQLAAPMQLMMNAWYGDNAGTALAFPGYYAGAPGKAEYRSVWIGK